MLGRLRPEFFPRIFGDSGRLPLDADLVSLRFSQLAGEISSATGLHHSPADVATGFLQIAVDNMANAVKKISVQRGYDVTEYTLSSFGGAGGQHACLVADALAIKTVFVHPLAGVLSAYGIGLADVRVLKAQAVEAPFEDATLRRLDKTYAQLALNAAAEIASQGVRADQIRIERRLALKYQGTDSTLDLLLADLGEMKTDFERQYRARYGFLMPDRALTIESITLEAVGVTERTDERAAVFTPREADPAPLAVHAMYSEGAWRDTPFFEREALRPGDSIDGPAVICESNATTIVEPGWRATLTALNHLFLRREAPVSHTHAAGSAADPVRLELFNNLFMSIAEQMGVVLAKTAHSVNIKERLDFSCALFDGDAQLIANAPHMPVHLGSMGESVLAVLNKHLGRLQPGDVYLLNAPYAGGTHLPDVTAVMPIFDAARPARPTFFVAARGHHADIGGITPGSMPPFSASIGEEGVLIDNFELVACGVLRETAMRELLQSGAHPSRNPAQNLADMRAQIAANAKGSAELKALVAQYGLNTVIAYMRHVQDNAEESVRRVITSLKDGHFILPLDNGSRIEVAVRVDAESRSACIDFTGTSAQLQDNFNAPRAVTTAAVLYVFRTLVNDDIPLNAGCLKPLQIILPDACMLNPKSPAAVVAGNVETSMCVTNALYGALGAMAASQCTMNNFTFGNGQYQYYETIAGGSGAGPEFDGTSVVQTHMTNSRLTDPEVLEFRFPVRLESYEIRARSGGAGRWKGGDGGIRRVRFLECMTASILSNGRTVGSFGMAGGESGAVGENYIERADGRVEKLAHIGQVDVQPDDVMVICTPGGGGYGKV